jgi:hypothetical protein
VRLATLRFVDGRWFRTLIVPLHPRIARFGRRPIVDWREGRRGPQSGAAASRGAGGDHRGQRRRVREPRDGCLGIRARQDRQVVSSSVDGPRNVRPAHCRGVVPIGRNGLAAPTPRRLTCQRPFRVDRNKSERSTRFPWASAKRRSCVQLCFQSLRAHPIPEGGSMPAARLPASLALRPLRSALATSLSSRRSPRVQIR